MATNSCFGRIMEEGDNAGFFKILRKEDLSSETMRGIPHNFIRSISDKDFSFKMVLNLPWGSSWPVKISCNPNFYYMEKRGWDQFVSDNALGDNEFLTFTHKGNMCFSVNIYQIDCKEMLRLRKSATIASSSGRNKREQENDFYKDVKKEEIESSSSSRYPGPKTAESAGRRLKLKRELNLGKKKVEKAEKSMKKEEEMDTDCEDSEANTSSLVPEFTITIKKSYLFFLGIPKKFVEMHMPKETKMFKIHHPNGNKSWEVMYVVTNLQSRFSAGWIRLAKEALVVGDVCTFKLIKPTEMLLKMSKRRDSMKK